MYVNLSTFINPTIKNDDNTIIQTNLAIVYIVQIQVVRFWEITFKKH